MSAKTGVRYEVGIDVVRYSGIFAESGFNLDIYLSAGTARRSPVPFARTVSFRWPFSRTGVNPENSLGTLSSRRESSARTRNKTKRPIKPGKARRITPKQHNPHWDRHKKHGNCKKLLFIYVDPFTIFYFELFCIADWLAIHNLMSFLIILY